MDAEKLQRKQDDAAWEHQQSSRAMRVLGPAAERAHDNESDFDFVFAPPSTSTDPTSTSNRKAEVDVGFIEDNDNQNNVDDPENNFPTDTINDKDDSENDTIEQLETTHSEEWHVIQRVRRTLPAYHLREDLLDAIRRFQVIVVVGETGSGKTTQIPQFLHEAGYTANGKMIACTQPRRIAAMSVAQRVASEMDVNVGSLVGYAIRFESKVSRNTVIKYMTDGMLLREFLTDPELKGYSCIMIDEAHERTLHTDILFGLIKDIAKFRPELRILICSATLDADKFSDYFDNAPIFTIPGRRYPVSTFYTPEPVADYISEAAKTVLTIHVTLPPGDILVFLTGQDEIEKVEESLLKTCKEVGDAMEPLIITPCYANLPADMQAKVFETTPSGSRKVVLATNIAETSITINGIVYVVDTGFEKQNVYNPRTGMESLEVVPCSQASANQRKGRAGRVSAGKCFRLYTKWSFENELPVSNTPEIQRSNMGNTLLLLKSLGINDLMTFDFLDSPPAQTIMKALELLYSLGALNDKGELTLLGKKMSEFPLDPMLSKTIIGSADFGCSAEVATIVAMISVASTLFFRPKARKDEADRQRLQFFRKGGDHLMLLAVWESWIDSNCNPRWCFEHYIQARAMQRAKSFRDQIVSLMKRVKIEYVSFTEVVSESSITGTSVIGKRKSFAAVNEDKLSESVRKAFTAGFFPHTARLTRDGESYKVLQGKQTTYIHPSSSLAPQRKVHDTGLDRTRGNDTRISTISHVKRPKWVIYQELVLTVREYMRQVIEIDPQWLVQVAPHLYNATWLLNIENEIAGHTKKARRM